MKLNKKNEKVANRDRHVDFRVNDEEYAIGLKNAEACGLSVSEYSLSVLSVMSRSYT